MKFEAVDGPKVTFDPANFLLKDEVVETSVELSGLAARGGDFHGFLTTTQHHL